MEILEIKVSRKTRMVDLPKQFISVEGENLQSKLVFIFTDEFINGQARLEYKIGNKKNYIVLKKENNTYTTDVKDVITKEGQINMQLVITEGTNENEIPRFKSNMFYLFCNSSINAVDEAPDGYELWIEQANVKLNQVDDALLQINDTMLYTKEQGDYAKEQGNYAKTVGEEVETKVSEGAFNGKSLEFIWKDTKLGIRLEGENEYTYVDLQGVQGVKGDTGEPFKIKKTYSSIEEMKADFENMLFGDYVMIATNVEVEDNAKLFSKGETDWIFITDFSGAMGIRGATGLTPNIKIGTVNTLESSEEATVTRTGTNEEPIFNFGIPKGPQGDDYVLQENDKQEIIENITSDANSVFNQNVTEKTNEFNENAEAKVNEFNETVDSLQEEIDDLYNNQLFSEASGESIHITDSANAKVSYLEIEGNSHQETTTGKNKLAILPYENYVSNGITTSFDGRTFSYSGTLTSSWFDLCKNYDTNLQAGRYLLSVTSKDLNRVVLAVTYEDGTYGAFQINTNAVNVVETKQVITKIRLFKDGQTTGDVLNGAVEYCMLEPMTSGDTPTEYEPYTGGIASPNPDYPSEVEVIEAYNLIPFTYQTQTINGVEFLVNEDGTITVNGTATANTYFNLGKPTLQKGDYILTGLPSAGSSSSFKITFKFEDVQQNLFGTEGKTFTINEEATAQEYYLFIANGYTANNLVFKPMIAKGTKVRPYLPYGKIGIKTIGKNLLPNNATSKTINGVTFTVNEDKTITVNGTATANAYLSVIGTTIDNNFGDCILTGCPSGGSSSTYFIMVNYKDNTEVYKAEAYDTGSGIKITNEHPRVGIYIYVKSGQTVSNLVFKPMISKDGGEYEPYKELITYIDLQGNFVGKLPNGTKDRLYIENNHLYLEKRVGEHTLISDDAWEVYNKYYALKKTSISDGDFPLYSNNYYCSHFIPVGKASANLGEIYVGGSNINFNYDDGTNGLDNFKTFLSTNKPKVYYKLKEPQIIVLGYIKTPKTLEKTSNISLLAKLETNMSVKYVQHTKTILDNIQNQINNIMTATIPLDREVE